MGDESRCAVHHIGSTVMALAYRKFTDGNGETKYRLYGSFGGVFSTYIDMIKHIDALRNGKRI